MNFLFKSIVFVALLAMRLSALESFPVNELMNDGCMEPIETHSAELAQFNQLCFPSHQNNFRELNVPDRVLNWGSNGLLGKTWQFNEDVCNQFYYSLFKAISSAYSEIYLSPHDLFHAHLVGYGADKNKLSMVFHAKEYPSDAEAIKNYYQVESEKFSVGSRAFEKRNFLYLSHDGENKIYIMNNQGQCQEYFSSKNINTISEKKIAQNLLNGRKLGDVNVFLPANLPRINYKFYAGMNEYTAELEHDLEAVHTGKSLLQRVQSNAIVNVWTASLSSYVIYFLTGL
ncbi:MAG: hypothetical protein KC505_07790 [Myxococcales bacterium]|nr:hypothetical protein [Myxococcales bacterium]USN50646.1 MAG: hypothetical protein H6731_10350 [Myxococcales bacterium]